MLLYRNTPEQAASIGWAQLPEHTEGDRSLPYVLHDHVRGKFVFKSGAMAQLGVDEGICTLVEAA